MLQWKQGERVTVMPSSNQTTTTIIHEPIMRNFIQAEKMINAAPIQYHNYLTLMSGTCHLEYKSKLGLLRVITWLSLECIWADRINGRKTQRSVTGDTVLLINHHKALQPPCIKICC